VVQAIRVLRDAAWLTPERALAWCRVLALLSCVAVVAAVGSSQGGVDFQGKPLGTDFLSFYAASRLAEAGHTGAPYDPALHEAMERAVLPGVRHGYYAFLYPPPFLLLCWPLAMLPYLWSLGAWLGAGLLPLLAVLRQIAPRGIGLLPMLAYPAVLVNAGHGQNAYVSAALFGGYMVFGERRPGLAGACLGALVFKPHLGLCVPVALVAARRWRALAGAAVTASAFMAASWLALGSAAWRGFLASTALSRAMLEHGLNGFEKMQSTFAAIRLLGFGIAPAWAAQAAVMAAVSALLALICARRPGMRAEGAMLAVTALLVAPGSLDYDLCIAAPAMAWLLARAAGGAFLPWEKIVLLAAFVLPLVTRALAGALLLPLGPPVLLGLLLAVRRRAAAA
jgi:hypothetical protein